MSRLPSGSDASVSSAGLAMEGGEQTRRGLKRSSASSASSASSSLSSCSGRENNCGPTFADDCQSLLKRVRISMSPGELRLERDLSQLVGWSRMEERLWHLDARVKLERGSEDGMELMLHVDAISVYLHLGRLYPHTPPEVTRVVNGGPIQAIAVTLVESSEGKLCCDGAVVGGDENDLHSASAVQQKNAGENDEVTHARIQPLMLNPNTLHYNQWSPVRELSDLLSYIVDSLRHVTTASSSAQPYCYPADVTTPTDCCGVRAQTPDIFPPPMGVVGGDWTTNVVVHEENGMGEGFSTPRHLSSLDTMMALSMFPSKHGETLAPNRFDIGYERCLRRKPLSDRNSPTADPMDADAGAGLCRYHPRYQQRPQAMEC